MTKQAQEIQYLKVLKKLKNYILDCHYFQDNINAKIGLNNYDNIMGLYKNITGHSFVEKEVEVVRQWVKVEEGIVL